MLSLRVFFSLFQRTSRFCGMRFLARLYVDVCHRRLGEDLPPQGNEAIGHFRVPKHLTFKTRLSAKPLL